MVYYYPAQGYPAHNAWPAGYAGYAPTVAPTESRSHRSRRNTIQVDYSPVSTSSRASLPGSYRLHSLIAAPNGHSSRSNPNLQWDVRLPPSYSRIPLSPKRGVPSRNRVEYATNPPTSHMQISCELFGSQWLIDVSNRRGVTIDDVLEQIFASLRKPLRNSEWARMSESDRAYVSRAFYKRAHISENPDHEKASGTRRVDCLQKHSVFLGLKPDPLHPGSWVLTTMRRD